MRAVLAAVVAAIAAVALTVGFSALAAGNGHVPQSGVAWTIGPYTCDATDIPNPGDTAAMFTPSPGMVVLAAFPNPRTFETFTADGDPIVLLGQATELPDHYWALADSDLLDGMVRQSTLRTNYPKVGANVVHTAEMFPLAEPVVCENSPDGGVLTGGHVDWYFTVATPAAP